MNKNTTQLDTGICYSYVEYISAYLSILNDSMFFSTKYFDEETFTLQETLKKQFLALPELLSATEAEKEACIHTLLKSRQTIEEKYRTLIAYQRELTLLLSMKQNDPDFITAHFESIGIDPSAAYDLDFEQLTKDCTSYVFTQTTGEEKQKRAAMLLPYIPIKITRANYVQYVTKSIRHIAITNNVESAEHLVSILNQLFDGRSYIGYGKHFADLKVSLDNLTEITDTEELFEEANLLNETLDSFLTMLENMFRMLCTYSNLLIPSDIDFNELTNMNAAFFDLYYAIKNILLGTEDAEMLKSTLPERLEKIQEDLKKQYVACCKKEQTPTPSFTLMQTYLAMHIGQLFGFSTAKHSAYSPEVLSILTQFTTKLKEKLDLMPTTERKYRMQYFISQIPFVMSKEVFEAYTKQAFTNVKEPKYTMLIASQLTGILEENHFFPSAKEEPVVETNYEEDDEAVHRQPEADEPNVRQKDENAVLTDFYKNYLFIFRRKNQWQSKSDSEEWAQRKLPFTVLS